MGTWQEWLKLMRLKFALAAGFAAWVSTRISFGSTEGSFPTDLICACAMALSVIGASLYHYGTAWHMYHCKRQWIRVNHLLLRMAGLATLTLGLLCLTIFILRPWAILTYVVDLAIIMLYYEYLSPHWQLKNVTIAFTCVSPFLIGYLSGPGNYPFRWWVMGIYCLFLAREILKDIQDMAVDFGSRRTIPLRFGWTLTRCLAGVVMLAGTRLLTNNLAGEVEDILAQALLVAAIIWSVWIATSLVFNQVKGDKRHQESDWIVFALAIILASLTMHIYGL